MGRRKAPHDAELSVQSAELSANLGVFKSGKIVMKSLRFYYDSA